MYDRSSLTCGQYIFEVVKKSENVLHPRNLSLISATTGFHITIMQHVDETASALVRGYPCLASREVLDDSAAVDFRKFLVPRLHHMADSIY